MNYFFSLQFFEGIKSVIRDKRSILAAGLLGIISMVYFSMTPWTTLLTVLVPFSLWMAG